MKKVQTCLVTIKRIGGLVACDPSDFALYCPKTKSYYRYIELDNSTIQFYAVPTNLPLVLSYDTSHMSFDPNASIGQTPLIWYLTSDSINWDFSTDKDVTIDIEAF